MSIEALKTRRAKIVAQLAAELGLPEQDIRGALEQIAPDQEFATPPDPEEITFEPPGLNGGGPASGPETAAEPSPPPRRRRRLWPGLAVLAIVAAAVIVVATSGGPSPPKSRRAASTASTPIATAQTQTLPAPAHPTPGPVPAPLAGLPGGLAHAAGTVKLAGPVKDLRLSLTVRGLPAPHAGHYEVWLYNSVLDSRPLARLRAGRHRLVVRLPAHARRYRWIDISFQPVGAINHSGESELRASNPAHTTMARLRRRSSRTRHRLRQASKVSVAHPATKHRTNRRTKAANGSTKAKTRTKGHRRRGQRLKRNARGSRKARTSK